MLNLYLSIFRYKRFTGALGIGTSWAFLGLFKQEEKEKKPLSEMDQVKSVVIQGIRAKQMGHVDVSSQAFHKALQMSSEFLKEEKITIDQHRHHLVFIFDHLANLNLNEGNFEEAEKLFVETMKLALQLGMPENDNAMMEMSLKLATIYLYTGKLDTGLMGLKHIIDEQEKKIAKEPVEKTLDPELAEIQRLELENSRILLGKAYRHYGTYYQQQQQFDKAEVYVKKALEMAKATLGPEHDQTFVIINDLAVMQISLKQFDQAEATLMEGLKCSQRANSLMSAVLYTNLGNLYMIQKQLGKAESVCNKGLKIAEDGRDKYLIHACQTCLKEVAELKQSKDK